MVMLDARKHDSAAVCRVSVIPKIECKPILPLLLRVRHRASAADTAGSECVA